MRGCFASSSPTRFLRRTPSQLVRRLRVRAEEIDRDFQAEILPLASRVPGRFRLIAAREGADYFAWRAAWFRNLEAELADDVDPDPGGRR